MVYGLIISAGRQSRFKSDVPKALANVNGKTLLDRNISAMSNFCDKIYVVCSYENQHYFQMNDKIVIHSGKGSGDAVWQAIERIGCSNDDLCYIMWGDCLHTKKIFEVLQSRFTGTTLIPCVKEDAPYVQIMQCNANTVKVSFSKFNEETAEGYHDLSLFYGPMSVILDKLREFRNVIVQPDGNYIHKHGNEMEFLDVFNETDINAEIVDCTGYEDFSFNTIEQLQTLIGTN